MALRIYNTLKQTKEEFRPLEEGKAGMYVCGVTVYGPCHMGHARVYVAFDAIYRYLKHIGYDTKYVRNFTDVDDKIIRSANELGISAKEHAERYIGEFYQDMKSLNVQPVDAEPRVTEHMDDIVAMIQRIIDNGHGYAVDGEVFFDIESFKGYGKLSGRNIDDMRVAVRDDIEVDERRRNPLDFVLWKPAKPGEPSWPSPWGDGRPGWHIECSCMSERHLGATFDIHGGGKDLIFPHHENEIAQSEAANGEDYVRYWMHNGFVTVDETKMSKSLKNFMTVRQAMEVYHPQALRYFLLTTHYRSPINFSEANLAEATQRVQYIYETLYKMDAWIAQEPPKSALDEVLEPERIEGVYAGLREAMDDDFNTARAIGNLSEIMTFANQVIDGRSKAAKKRRHATLKALRAALKPVFEVLGVFEHAPAEVLEGIRERKLKQRNLSAETIETLIAERKMARDDKDFARADEIRGKLDEMGVCCMDSPEGTTWKIV